MSAAFPTRTAVAIALAMLLAAVALAGAQGARAVFNDGASGGPMTLKAATLAAPKNLAASQVNCRSNKNPEVKLEWTTGGSSYATSQTVERRSGAGSYATVATLGATQTSYTDKNAALESSTTYYYRVSTAYRSWSAVSIENSLKTLSKSCQ